VLQERGELLAGEPQPGQLQPEDGLPQQWRQRMARFPAGAHRKLCPLLHSLAHGHIAQQLREARYIYIYMIQTGFDVLIVTNDIEKNFFS
jgi:hypothetical protein